MELETVFPERYYINLGQRDDRRHAVEVEFLQQGLTVQRHPAVNAAWLKSSRGYPTKGKYACALSKCLALRRARNAGVDAVLLFEDDVVFAPGFAERIAALELAEDWGLFYLGCRHVERPEPVGPEFPGLVRVRKAYDNHAVAIKAAHFDEAIRLMRGVGKGSPERKGSSDGQLAALHQTVPTYAAYPNLIWQGAFYSELQQRVYTNYTETGSQVRWPEAVEGLEWEMAHPGQRWSDRETDRLDGSTGEAEVECVVVAWRAENLEPVLKAFRGQTVPCFVTVVVANRMANGAAVPEEVLKLADRVFRLSEDFGAYNRFLPAFACDKKYVYLHDDDMLPGPRCVEHFLREARRLGNFGVIGQEGRIFPGGNSYDAARILPGAEARQVDMIVRGYFLPSRNLPLILQARLDLELRAGDDLEDDMILACAMRRNRLPAYVIREHPDPATRNCCQELSNAAARHRRPDHLAKRQAFVRQHLAPLPT